MKAKFIIRTSEKKIGEYEARGVIITNSEIEDGHYIENMTVLLDGEISVQLSDVPAEISLDEREVLWIGKCHILDNANKMLWDKQETDTLRELEVESKRSF